MSTRFCDELPFGFGWIAEQPHGAEAAAALRHALRSARRGIPRCVAGLVWAS